MRIDAAIAALRADPGLQRHAQAATIAACEAWRAEALPRAALAELERFGAGAPLEACPALEAMFTDQHTASELVSSLMDRMSDALARRPFGHPPFRHGFDGATSTLLLARAGRAQLVLLAREPGQYDFTRASFSDALRYEAVLAGSAEGRIVRQLPAGIAREPVPLVPGVRLAFDLTSESLQVTCVRQRLVTLRLHRFATEPRPTCELSLATGALLHQSSGDLAASRREMMLTVLGRMKRAEAAPAMAQIAKVPGDASLRWQALRECLALDTGLGFRALLAIARAADDPLCGPAGALRAQLVEAHPALLALENDECRA